MLDAVGALKGLDTRVFDASTVISSPHDGSDCITVPDAHLLFNGEFKRVGTNDLKIVGSDGKSFYIENYFSAENHKNLMSPEGALLTANLVDALAGPLAPGQHAQAGAQPAAAPPVIGRVDAASGSCTVIRNGVTVVLNVGDNVRKGDVVVTSASSAVAIVFLDGSTFSLSANARMVLDEFVYAAGASNNSAVISLVQGTFSFVAGQVAKAGDMKVETPVATMGIRGTAVLVEISANDGQTKFSVMVEPNGTTGSFNLYNKTTGALIGTVNNSTVGWVVTPAGPLQVVAQQVNKSPAELAQELGIVQQLFNIFNNYQQNPIDPDRRGDNQNGPQNAGPGGSGSPLNTDNPNGQTTYTVTITKIDDAGLPGGGTGTGGTGTGGTGTGTDTGTGSSGDVVPLPTGTFTLINGSGVIIGTPGDDHIFGSTTPDTITALAGDDQVFAGGGDDTIIAGHGEGNDFYDGGGHDLGDTIKYESANGVTFNLNVGSRTLADGTVVSLSTADAADIGHDEFVRIEKIVGSPGDDVFILHQWVDWEIDAGAGIDIVRFADGLDVQNVQGGQEISNFEIVDLATDLTENIIYFDLGDFDSIGNSVPLRILGGTGEEGDGEQDIIHLTNDFNTNAQWTPHGTFTDQAGTGANDPFSDSYSNGITFDVYEVTIGEESYFVYVQQGVQIDLANNNPTAGNVTIFANAIGNGGFESNPDFLGWTVDEDPSGLDLSQPFASSAFIDRSSGSIFVGDNAVAVLTFNGWLPEQPYPYEIPASAEGPSITSDVFTGYAGDTIRLVYQLSSGSNTGTSDTGTVTARIIDVSQDPPQVIQEITDDAPLASSTGMLTFNVQLEESGQFQIEFVVGSIDDTLGLAVGARLDIGFAGIIQNGISEDAAYTFAAEDLLANATDSDGDTLTLASVATSAYGALVFINQDGTVTYDPTTAATIQALAAGETLNDTFTYTVVDSHGAVSNTATATITVLGVNDAPEVLWTPDTAAVTMNKPFLINGMQFDDIDAGPNEQFTFTVSAHHGSLGLAFDPAAFGLTQVPIQGDDNDTSTPLPYQWSFSGSLANINLALAAGIGTGFIYDPESNYTGQSDFTFTVTDSHGASDSVQLSIDVESANIAPEIHVEDATTTGNEAETTLAGLSVTDSDADPEEHFTANVSAQWGSLRLATPGFNELDEDGSPGVIHVSDQPRSQINLALADGIIYTAPSFSAGLTDKVTLTVTDGHGASDTTNFLFSVFGDTGVELSGSEQKDVLFNTGSNDILAGNGGADIFVFGNQGDNGIGQDIISDFSKIEGDKIALYDLYADFDALQSHITQIDGDTRIDFSAFGQNNMITLSGFTGTLSAADFIFHPNNSNLFA